VSAVVSIATIEEAKDIFALAKQYDGGFSRHVKVDVDYATGVWMKWLSSGVGIVFALKKDGRLIGGLGAIKLPDIHCGLLTAVETFWFTNPEDRGDGLKLLNAYEKWAEDTGCKRVAIIHLEDSFPEALSRIYKRRGYELVESHYVREIGGAPCQ
jgi:GNAT superfamily N-acetyltransferase